MGVFLVRGADGAAIGGRAGGDVVGRGAAGRGPAAARGSGGAGRGAVRSGAAGADHGALAPRGSADGAGGAERWASDDRDRDLRAVDGAQAPLWLGLSDTDGRGLRFDSSAALLPD